MPFFNRELSWLAFNRRVLEQAWNERNPLLERLKFLAIVSSNLDEFFEIRVAGLIQQVDSDIVELGLDGLSAREQLRRIHLVVASQVEEQYRCWHQHLLPELRRENIHFKTAAQLTRTELAWVRAYFKTHIYPVLTPLAVDASHPFPQLGNKTLNIVVTVDDPTTAENEGSLAILPVPRILPRVVRIAPDSRGPQRYIFLTEIIKLCAEQLFSGYRIHGAFAFRVTRNSDLYIDEEEAENLLKRIEDELRNLRRGAAVRLEIEAGVDDRTFERLTDHLRLAREYVFRIDGPLNLLRLFGVYDLIDRPDLKYPPLSAHPGPLQLTGENVFTALGQREILLHHPYDSFDPVVAFVQQAAADPQVFAIKQTLYRTSGDSPIVHALIEAAHNGKQVTALVELKARFDEANNIQWARQLEEAGVHVVYGVVGLKIHSKLCLVVRREADGMRHYAHLGTGNYNPRTARIYTDFSLFTARDALTAEVAYLFNVLTGFVREPRFRHLLVAPYNLHEQIQALILNEAEAARCGKPARIIAKMNSLVDRTTIESLYAASRAGVKIDLIVRGICCLVPGVPGLSENIRVRSIVGRFLEHARAFYFENHGGEPRLLLGSADWMPRNFFRRVEVVFPLGDHALRQRVLREVLEIELQDTESARQLRADGEYAPVARDAAQPALAAQEHFIAEASRRLLRNDEEG
ncbi:MAG: polyphosphate kinase 1 [Opitutaceae bacterium]